MSEERESDRESEVYDMGLLYGRLHEGTWWAKRVLKLLENNFCVDNRNGEMRALIDELKNEAKELLSEGASVDTYFLEKPLAEAHLAGQQHERERIWAAINEIKDYSYTSSIRQQLSAIIFEGQEK